MKPLINPPLNLLFTLISLVLIGLTVWSLMSLKLLSEDDHTSETYAKIEIPSSEALAVPPLRKYKRILDAPLFWESREKIVVVKKKPKAIEAQIAPIDKKLPDGRLIGIIDTGEEKMAVFQDTENSHYLKLNDTWGSWKLTRIATDSIELALGSERKNVDLISDFSAPAANRNKPTKRQLASSKRKKGLEESRRPRLPNNVKNLPNLASTKKQAPPISMPSEMTIKEALAARQRLMAARWKKKN